MTSGPDFGDHPIEDDPTGMRALLAGLPDPGPMPVDLVDRIQASLAQEAARRVEHPEEYVVPPPVPLAPTPRPTYADTTEPTPLRPRAKSSWGSRHNPGRWLAAAAILGLTVVGGRALITGGFSSGTQGADSAAIATKTGSAPAKESSPTLANPDAQAGGGASPEVIVTMSGTNFDSASLAKQVGSLLGASLPPLTMGATESPGIGPIGSTLGALSCAAELRLPRTGLRVDLGNYAGQPAALITAATGPGKITAYVVQRSCTTGHADRLAGPITVP